MFGKFMNKKFFHPGSYPNIKLKWMHEQKAAAKEKAEQEKKDTYQKEQENYQSRLLTSKSSGDKIKLGLNFMYDVPPGMQKDTDEINLKGEKEVKFEWQKTAPRSKYIADLGIECQDQPFGVLVRNIRCFKCKEWGHQNTDRECPMFFTDIKTESNLTQKQSENLRLSDPLRLVADMKRQHGIVLKRSVIGKEIDPMADNQQLLESVDDSNEIGDADLAFIETLSDKQKRKLLKSLNKLEHKSKKRKKRKHKHSKESDTGDLLSEDENTQYKQKKKKRNYEIENDAEMSYKLESDNISKRRNIHRERTLREGIEKRLKLKGQRKRRIKDERDRTYSRSPETKSSHYNDGYNDSDTDNETNKQIAELRKNRSYK